MALDTQIPEHDLRCAEGKENDGLPLLAQECAQYIVLGDSDQNCAFRGDFDCAFIFPAEAVCVIDIRSYLDLCSNHAITDKGKALGPPRQVSRGDVFISSKFAGFQQ